MIAAHRVLPGDTWVDTDPIGSPRRRAVTDVDDHPDGPRTIRVGRLVPDVMDAAADDLVPVELNHY